MFYKLLNISVLIGMKGETCQTGVRHITDTLPTFSYATPFSVIPHFNFKITIYQNYLTEFYGHPHPVVNIFTTVSFTHKSS